jgi:hypothetical protein
MLMLIELIQVQKKHEKDTLACKQGRIKTLGGPMPKDRGGPDQGIFQDFWTGV